MINNYFFSINRTSTPSVTYRGRYIANSAAYAGPAVSNKFSYSDDGITWTASNVQNTELDYDGHGCWSPELGIMVITGFDNSPYAGNTTASCWSSTDGITWAQRITPTWGSEGNVCWSPTLGKFLAVAQAMTKCIESTDGITWTTRTATGLSGLRKVIWSESLGLFLAAGYSGAIYTSPTGQTWSARTVSGSGGGGSGLSVAWDDTTSTGACVFYNGSWNRVGYSSNGTSWTQSTATARNYYDVCYSPSLGMFAACAAGAGTSAISTSTDGGKNWTTQTCPNKNVYGITWGSDIGLFVAAATDVILTSPDGVIWTSRIKAGANSTFGVFYVRFQN